MKLSKSIKKPLSWTLALGLGELGLKPVRQDQKVIFLLLKNDFLYLIGLLAAGLNGEESYPCDHVGFCDH